MEQVKRFAQKCTLFSSAFSQATNTTLLLFPISKTKICCIRAINDSGTHKPLGEAVVLVPRPLKMTPPRLVEYFGSICTYTYTCASEPYWCVCVCCVYVCACVCMCVSHMRGACTCFCVRALI